MTRFPIIALCLVGGAAEYLVLGDRLGIVAAEEGKGIMDFKPKECTGVCTVVKQEDLTAHNCRDWCDSNKECRSLAFCSGKVGSVGFPRCYLKDADFSVKKHKDGDCSTYLRFEHPLLGAVATDEGENIESYKRDCDNTPGCKKRGHKRTTLAWCEKKCKNTPRCNSFAWCSGNSKADFRRCYTKTRDFSTKPHEGGDCTTYYRQDSLDEARLYAVDSQTFLAPAPFLLLGGVAVAALIAGLLVIRVVRSRRSQGDQEPVEEPLVEEALEQ